jgi:diguanylate cyclase (GGDEF)-like protein/PAS domain S-box-containing protein
MNFLSLKSKLTLFTALLFVSTVIVLAYKLEREVRAEFQSVLETTQFSRLHRIADSIEDASRERLTFVTEAAARLNPGWLGDPARLERFLAEHRPRSGMFGGGLAIVSATGAHLAPRPRPGDASEPGAASSLLIREIVRRGTPVTGKPSRDPSGAQPVLQMGAPIKDGAGRVVAVLVGTISIHGDDLFGKAVTGQLRADEKLHVVSLDDNVFVASSDPDLVLKPLPQQGSDRMFDRYRSGFVGFGVVPGANGVDQFSSAMRMPTTGWLVLSTLPASVAFESIDSIQEKIRFGATLSSLLIPFLLWLYLNGQLKPLSRAASTLDEMTQGRKELQPLLSEGSKEIRRLLNSFNLLQTHIGLQKASLRDSAEKLRLSAKVFESSCEGIVIADADMHILSTNGAFTRMTGYDAEEVGGKTMHLLNASRSDPELLRRMLHELKDADNWQGEVLHQRRNGETYPAWLHVSVIRDAENRPCNYIMGFLDISDRKQAEARIEFMAYHDPLTGLPNRRLGIDRLNQAIAYADRAGSKTALIFLDLDNFKTINDSFGHAVGDLLLQAVASRLSECTRDCDTICRQGGDEFLLVLGNVQNADAITAVTEKILETLSATFEIEGNELSTSTSIGIAVYPDDGRDIETLLKRADTAMYHAKETGRNAYSFFTEQMNIDAVEHHRIRVGLLHALHRGEFRLNYQPQIDLVTGAVVGAEALIRWNHPQRGELAPDQFITVAEDSGLIVPIGDWVLREACRQAAAWRMSGLPHLVVAVNVSAIQFTRGDLEASVRTALEESGLPPASLELELTESILIQNTEQVLLTVQRLKSLGVMLSIDDFGTGYSSLSYLTRFKVDKLKIDRSFVCDMENQPNNALMVRAIIQMAASLNLKTIAEGVEDEELVDFLRHQHCGEAQGFYFSRPMPAIEFADYLMRDHAIAA